jgi:octaprenyl-diphosphate synthase
MKITEEIKLPIAQEMELFEEKFRIAMSSKVALLNRITHYIVNRKGKQMRPMFVFLTAKMIAEGKVNERTYRGASVIELIHTATLVHDDVVDDSNKRRGFFSINALWKNKIAVLVGDYLLSQGLSLSVKTNQFKLLGIMSKTVKEMSEGELLQQEKSRKLDITESVYYEIIRQKTASLIAACCESGALSANASDTDVQKMARFGELVGMAFQIKDDLFDFGVTSEIGKPVGIDIQERKMTLPLIYTLSKVDASERRELLRIVRKFNTNREKVQYLMGRVEVHGGIAYAWKKMIAFRDEAIEILESFPETQARNSLQLLVNYTIERNK